MKLTFVVFAALLSLSAVASSSDALVKACQKAGVEKVLLQARALGLSVNASDVKECGVDNRPLNVAAKYVWFCATTTGGEKKIQVMTQKPLFRDCF